MDSLSCLIPGASMLTRSSFCFCVIAIASLLVLGCAEPEVDFEVPRKVAELPPATWGLPIEPERTLFFLVEVAQDEALGFAVYAGRNPTPEFRFDARTEPELTKLISSHVNTMFHEDPVLDTVLIDCDGSLKTVYVEIVKSGVSLADTKSLQKVFVSIRDDADN